MSKPLVVSLPHELGRAEARRRIDAGVAQLVGQVGAVGALTQSWKEDVLHFSLVALGQTLTGQIAVEDREVRMEIVLPGVLGLLAGKLKGRIRDQGQVLLEGPRKA